jgi:transaldolase
LFFELALEDLTQPADLFRPVNDTTGGLDGWVSLEVSPLLADDTAATVQAAVDLHARAQRPNLFIKVPGTRKGIPAIEAAIFAGVPVNVTLLFSREQYVAAAEAYLRGLERRVEAGLDPKVWSVASLFVSRWDVAVEDKVTGQMRNRLGIAIAQRTYQAYRELLASSRWRKLAAAGAQTLRWLPLSSARFFGKHRPRRPPDGNRGAARSTPGTPSPSLRSPLQAVTPLAPVSVALSPDAAAPG